MECRPNLRYFFLITAGIAFCLAAASGKSMFDRYYPYQTIVLLLLYTGIAAFMSHALLSMTDWHPARKILLGVFTSSAVCIYWLLSHYPEWHFRIKDVFIPVMVFCLLFGGSVFLIINATFWVFRRHLYVDSNQSRI